MAVARAVTALAPLVRNLVLASPLKLCPRVRISTVVFPARGNLVQLPWRGTCEKWRCLSSSKADSSERMPARLAQKQQELDALPEYEDLDVPVPKVTLDHVTVNTKVDMRFNVMQAEWLPLRIREKLLITEKNRVNSDGELVISSTRTRTQKGNIEDALSKLQQLIDAASYVPPPPSKEKLKRIEKLAKADNERRLNDKKKAGSKKADRRNKGSWD
uniref:Prokaryotic-type class I peptide chain release factors domain-containing protein n=1 Tax=Physcomitrium patens TaxID=3218 RepID=A0A7I4EQ57_PHYPA